jgi:hypothetical protein
MITLKHKGDIEITDGTITVDGSPVGGGLSGTQYVYVAANGSDVDNAAELQAAYNQAKTMSQTADNRITIIAAPGNYNFGSIPFVMDEEFIDLVSLDGNKSIIFNSSNSAGTISITANDVFVKGVDVLTKNFTIGDNLNLLKVENCQGGDYSFGGGSFGAYGTASGTFTYCQGGNGSFGAYGTASGTFTYCQGGGGSFGTGGTASGTFTDCISGDNSFAGIGTASGTFTNCIGGNFSFGGFGTASGTFTNCIGGNFSFAGIGTASGTFTNCQGIGYSFGGGDRASGTFTNCIGDDSSFAGDGGTLQGKLYYCRLTSGTFRTVSSGGRTIYCIDGVDNTNNQ